MVRHLNGMRSTPRRTQTIGPPARFPAKRIAKGKPPSMAITWPDIEVEARKART